MHPRRSKPGGWLPHTTTPFRPALPLSIFVPYLITHQAFAQELWIPPEGGL